MAKSPADPVASAQRWAANLSGATAKLKASVQALSTSPTQLAAAQKTKWLANVTASADRWANALQSVSLSDWQNAMINKGVPRIAQGASTAQPKVQAFLSQWIPFEQQVVASLPARGSLQQNIQRAVELINANAQAKGKFRQAGRSR